ncbi:sensor histidine kinase [Ruania alkalisoli]|uniref:histidine kinase n=1 Tax=Ruania alkalisoli TaxID=2779775 RepID=A0A7M1SSZ7_9MICO|nr:histidine kinase [Ruania alkalisoli]QOR69912.1 sensor histidine kinase [Ruania alkalisoli]
MSGQPHPGSAGAPVILDDHIRRGPIRRFFVAHPIAMDVLLVVIFLVPHVVLRAVIDPRPAPYVTLLAAAAALFWRRHRPRTVLLTLCALIAIHVLVAGDTGGIELALAFSLYTVVTTYGSRAGWLGLAVATVVSSVAVLLWGDQSSAAEFTVDGEPALLDRAAYVAGNVVGILATLLVALAIGVSVRSRREQLQRLVDHANQFRLERDQREQIATANERARIAREMHDVVAHSLSVMVALADGARASVVKAPERSADALTELSRTGRSALGDMRRILGVLREEDARATMEPQPDAPALEDLVAQFRAAGLEVAFSHSGPAIPDDAALQLTVYRIVQEGLTNVLRYAPRARRITVIVARRPHEVTVTVHNSRSDAPAERRPGSGQGLIGMRERAATYGGTVKAGPDDAGGWRTHATLVLEGALAAEPDIGTTSGPDEKERHG